MHIDIGQQSNADLLNQIQSIKVSDSELKNFNDGFYFPVWADKKEFFKNHNPHLSRRAKLALFAGRCLRPFTAKSAGVANDLLAIRRTDDYLLAWYQDVFFKVPISKQAQSRIRHEETVLDGLGRDRFKKFLTKSSVVLKPFVHQASKRGRLCSGRPEEILLLDAFVADFYEHLKCTGYSHGDLHFNNILLNAADSSFLLSIGIWLGLQKVHLLILLISTFTTSDSCIQRAISLHWEIS